MILPGCLIEYIESGLFSCGLVLSAADKKVRLLSQNGRETNLAESRILLISRKIHSLTASREELMAAMQQTAAK